MRHIIVAILVTLMLLSSCSPVPGLWGAYVTPTPEFQIPTLALVETPALLASSTPPPQPTSSSTLLPTPVPQESSTGAVPVDTSLDQVSIEASLTPTFDVPAVLYYTQSGDSISAIVARFSIDSSEIRGDVSAGDTGFLAPGMLLVMPDRIVDSTTPGNPLIPDSELVMSASAADFDIASYIASAGGRLSTHREYLGSTGWNSGPDEITRLAFENSINPRLLLALLEYESRWVNGEAVDAVHGDYPMGYLNLYYKGLFGQMLWTVNQLSIGYYGWRAGTLTELQFPDGSKLRINPELNAGSVAIQYLFSKLHNRSQWAQMIDPGNGILALYTQMFGDPWARAEGVDPLFPPGLTQPPLVLPFEPETEWSYTGGPHGAWEHDGSMAAVDFAPSTDHGGCDPTPTWITAAASGLIIRSERGVVVQDLDGDGLEQTGWNLVYLHVASADRVMDGKYLEQDDRIGHASCEGGQATGTHLHFARKYNGEWVAADGPMPLVMSGWTIHEGSLPYGGTMTLEDKVIIADPVGQRKSVIIRTLNDE